MADGKLAPVFPGWSQKFRFWRKKYWQQSWSQVGEDRYLAHLVNGKTDGFYLDVGCFHPEQYSNTRLLHGMGWRGINIDMSPTKVGLFEWQRPTDQNIVCPVSDQELSLDVYLFGNDSAFDTTDAAQADIWKKTFNKEWRKISLPSRRLDNILDDLQAPAQIDFLNIDVEGAEMGVLRSFPFETRRLDIVAIEIHADFAALPDSPVYRFLTEQNFELVAWLQPTAIFQQRKK